MQKSPGHKKLKIIQIQVWSLCSNNFYQVWKESETLDEVCDFDLTCDKWRFVLDPAPLLLFLICTVALHTGRLYKGTFGFTPKP